MQPPPGRNTYIIHTLNHLMGVYMVCTYIYGIYLDPLLAPPHSCTHMQPWQQSLRRWTDWVYLPSLSTHTRMWRRRRKMRYMYSTYICTCTAPDVYVYMHVCLLRAALGPTRGQHFWSVYVPYSGMFHGSVTSLSQLITHQNIELLKIELPNICLQFIMTLWTVACHVPV